MGKYVCAFRGRRDSYQVPVALAEGGLLEQFITDAYALPWIRTLAKCCPRSVLTKLNFRSEPGIPMESVRCLWGTTVVEHLRHRLGYAPLLTYNKLDRNFSAAVARRAAQTRSHLFLYSPYAWEAFTAKYPHAPRKVLFQYHPHPELEKGILAADSARHPDVGESFSGGTTGQLPEELARRERDSWKHADLIFCASTFTKRSLLEAGADEGRCRVIPYGVDVPLIPEGTPPAEAFHVVFVGSGGQRKGLHHLLLAWQRAALPASSKLTLVCRVIDRGIERLAAKTPGVMLQRGVTQRELNHIFASSTLFLMPSLVEGFGQVYLEALAQGCPVLGTENTCLPDIGNDKDGVYTVSPGDTDELTAKLESLSIVLPGDIELREAARTCAARFPWYQFRQTLRKYLAV
jgi:glycosyltransferase involved in cell wall biosynthesis